MVSAVFAPPIGPEFDRFLCAFIGEDPNGTSLSVLSAFARTGVDPWKEAECLARMPRESATTRLSEFISALPNKPNANVPARTIASELIKLLPTPATFVPPMPLKLAAVVSNGNSRFGFAAWIVLLLLGLAYFLGIAPTSRTVSPPSMPDASTSTPIEPPRDAKIL